MQDVGKGTQLISLFKMPIMAKLIICNILMKLEAPAWYNYKTEFVYIGTHRIECQSMRMHVEVQLIG